MSLRTIVFHPDPASIEAWNGQLQAAGLRVVKSATSYENVHVVLSKHPCDLILVTLTEDLEPGLLALQEIHQRMPRANIIVYGLNGPDRRTLKICKELNVLDFLVQPVSLDRMRQSFKKVKAPEEKRERGAVVCVGYTPTHAERAIINQMKLSYLYYPSCHLAIQMFQQRQQKRLIILIIQEDLERYSSALTKPVDPLQLLDEDFLPPWKEVVREAQVYYQEFWREGIINALLPRQIPCLYVPNKGGAPQFLQADVINTMKMEHIGIDHDFQQIVEPGADVSGAEEAVQKVTEKVNDQLDEVEEQIPELIHGNTETEEQPAIKTTPKIEKKKVPDERPPKNANRMTRRGDEEN